MLLPAIQRPEPGHVGPVDQLDMLDPVPQVGPPRRLIAVDGLPHRPVADGMDRCAHLDLTLACPTYTDANTDGLMIDTVHPTSRGHGWMGARVAQALLAAS